MKQYRVLVYTGNCETEYKFECTTNEEIIANVEGILDDHGYHNFAMVETLADGEWQQFPYMRIVEGLEIEEVENTDDNSGPSEIAKLLEQFIKENK